MEPTVGRIVHYYAGDSDPALSSSVAPGEPAAAIVARVWEHGVATLAVFSPAGGVLHRPKVNYHEQGSERSAGAYWEWPFLVAAANATAPTAVEDDAGDPADGDPGANPEPEEAE